MRVVIKRLKLTKPYNMKNTIYKFLACLFITFAMNSQNLSGKVTYTIKRNPLTLFKNKLADDIKYKNFQENVDDKIVELKFILEFSNNNSKFYLQDGLNLDLSEFYTEMSIQATRGGSIFYIDKKDKTLTEQVFFLGQKFLIKSSINDLKWELTKERKTIGKYLCFKATTLRENFGPVDQKYKFSTYTAWYCPELPNSFGPYEVCGLPGLVLEYTNDIMIYSASEVEFTKSNLDLKLPKSGKLVSRDEFNEIGKKAFESHSFMKD